MMMLTWLVMRKMMKKTNTATPSKPTSDLLYDLDHAKYPQLFR